MLQAVRKITGSFLIFVLMVLYALFATTFATANLGEYGSLVHLTYFFFTGILWILPAMLIIKWMLKPEKCDAP